MKIVIILIFLFVLFFVYNTSKFGEQNVNFLDEPMFYIINVPGPMGEERRNYINNVLFYLHHDHLNVKCVASFTSEK